MSQLKKLKNELREISWLHRLRAYLFEYPNSCGEKNEPYNEWLDTFLNEDIEIVSIDDKKMSLKSKNGILAQFWVSNYPYSYGNRHDIEPPHPYWFSYPNWKLVLRLRELQLSRRSEIITNYNKEMTKCNLG